MGLKKQNKEEQEAIEAFVKNYPNSFVADLLLYFDRKIVLQFIELYSGRRVNIPTIKNIWINYRNQKIKEALDKDGTRKNREIFAENFGLSIEHINVIYSEISKRHAPKIKYRTIENLVDTIFRKNLRSFYKEMHNLSGITGYSGQLHDSYQNPEFLCMLRQSKIEIIDRCVADIVNHLILSDREYYKELAVGLLLNKINNEM